MVALVVALAVAQNDYEKISDVHDLVCINLIALYCFGAVMKYLRALWQDFREEIIIFIRTHCKEKRHG